MNMTIVFVLSPLRLSPKASQSAQDGVVLKIADVCLSQLPIPQVTNVENIRA
jgi:hypothetical protein